MALPTRRADPGDGGSSLSAPGALLRRRSAPLSALARSRILARAPARWCPLPVLARHGRRCDPVRQRNTQRRLCMAAAAGAHREAERRLRPRSDALMIADLHITD